MTAGSDTSLASDASRRRRESEARLLAELLRTARLSVLFAEPGSDKTALLKHDLMPLLRRRAADRGRRSAGCESVVVPLLDRRGRGSAESSRRCKEVVVYFDDWDAPLLEALRTRIRVAAGAEAAEQGSVRIPLADELDALGRELDASFVILLDRCEEFLCASTLNTGIAELVDELVGAINRPGLPANFLMALDELARPRLADLRSKIPGIDDFSLRLARADGCPVPPDAPLGAARSGIEPSAPAAPAVFVDSVAPPSEGASDGPVKPPRRRSSAPPPSTAADVYAFIEAKLAETLTGIERGIERDPFESARPVAAPLPPAAAPFERQADDPTLPVSSDPIPPRDQRPNAVERLWRRLRRSGPGA